MNYQELAEIYEKLEGTSKRLEKTFYITDLLRKAPEEDIPKLTLLIQGKIFPAWDERKIGVASRLVIKAISGSLGVSEEQVDNLWRESGDLGLVAQTLAEKKRQATLFSIELSVNKVFSNFRKLAELTGAGTVNRKVQLISELLTSASPLEAKYAVRSLLEELRVGVGEGTLRDAIAWAFFPPVWGVFAYCADCNILSPIDTRKKCVKCGSKIKIKDVPKLHVAFKSREMADLKHPGLQDHDYIEAYDPKGNISLGTGRCREVYDFIIGKVQSAYDILNEFSEVALIAKKSGITGLESVELKPGRPIKVMLAQKAADMKAAFERVGKPAALEYKYDGFRMQVHRLDGNVRIFTRRLENVSVQFPEVVEYFKTVEGNYIIDAEAVGYNPSNGKYLPFQHISQRIKRKYGITDMAKKLPVELNVFDIMLLNGRNMLGVAFKERREALEGLIKPVKGKVVLAKQIVTDDDNAAYDFYKESLEQGNEGIMLKTLDNGYKPGSRVGFMVKLKPTMEALDLAITAAEWGEGKRAHWLTSFTLSCVEDGEFVEIGKVGTGIKELDTEEGVTFNQLTEMLKPHILSEKGREVKLKPMVIVEIKYEEIQKSPTYSSGYALRFPRVIRVREDLNPEEAAPLGLVEDFFDAQ